MVAERFLVFRWPQRVGLLVRTSIIFRRFAATLASAAILSPWQVRDDTLHRAPITPPSIRPSLCPSGRTRSWAGSGLVAIPALDRALLAPGLAHGALLRLPTQFALGDKKPFPANGRQDVVALHLSAEAFQEIIELLPGSRVHRRHCLSHPLCATWQPQKELGFRRHDRAHRTKFSN